MANNRYLIIAPAWIGDMVMSQSLYCLLKQQQPACHITVIAPGPCADIAHHMPEIDTVLNWAFPRGKMAFKARYRAGKSLRHAGYTHAIVLQNSWKSALIPWAAHIRTKTGYHGEMRYGLLNDRRRLNKLQLPTMIQRFCALASSNQHSLPFDQLPWPTLHINQAQIDQAKTHYLGNQATNRPLLILCPGAAYGPAKQWPIDYFRHLAVAMVQKGWFVLILGGPNEATIGQTITDQLDHSLNLAGKTALPDAMALIRQANHVVSNDSGLMHIACALNRRCTVLYGSSTHTFTPPLSQYATALYRTDLTCRPCFQRTCRFGHYHCLTQLSVQQVLDTIETKK